MIEIRANPTLLDFLMVASKLPEDEKDQIEKLSGCAYTVDGATNANYNCPGPKFGLYQVWADGSTTILAVGGFLQVGPGVWRDWMMTTPELWLRKEYWAPATRQIRKLMDEYFARDDVRVLECYSLASRTAAHRWYKPLGYVYEHTLAKRASGEDVSIFSRVKHG